MGDAHDFRDDIPGTTNYHGVAAPDILPAHFIFVVQRGVGYCDSTDKYRGEACNRGECAGAADLYLDIQHPGLRFRSRKFVRYGKSRGPGDEAQALLLRKGIDFIDNAVYVVRKISTSLPHFSVEVD